jgi:hypothetical protein
MKRCAWIVLAAIFASTAARGQDISVLVAPFDSTRAGVSAIGNQAAMILNMQIWQTLRRPTTAGAPSASGKVLWASFVDPPSSPQGARQVATYIADNPRLMLWGRAWKYGNGLVVEAFLLVRGETDDPSLRDVLWTVPLATGGSLQVGPPRTEVEFEPIVVRSDLLADLTDLSGLKLYADRDSNQVIGHVGNAFRALAQYPDRAQVTAGGKTGWVKLSNLSATHSEVVDFTAGLLRIYRHDWVGASELMTKVLDSPKLPMSVRIDANLYLALAAAQMGRDPEPWTSTAYKINPYSRHVIEFLCTGRLARYARSSGTFRRSPEGRSLLESVRAILERKSNLFPAQDPWLKTARNYVSVEKAR